MKVNYSMTGHNFYQAEWEDRASADVVKSYEKCEYILANVLYPRHTANLMSFKLNDITC